MDVNEKWRWQRRIGMFDQTWSVRTEKPGIATNLHDHPTFGDEHPFSAVSLDPSLNNTFTNWSDGSSATTTKLGNNTFTNFNDGTSATRTQLGDFGFTNFSNGASATSN